MNIKAQCETPWLQNLPRISAQLILEPPVSLFCIGNFRRMLTNLCTESDHGYLTSAINWELVEHA